ncbi:MAG: hypothetical protein HYY65_08605 [Candidatus Tectomicrobia bacterium]|uniref:Uncharacterized protein n=1 Tax=Tectimicrobiota bacterium TaxID=2528274 RepID=A0A932M149_UNCTE|nr:hypothetical protein [Candidatus Tectomicrobia bacterium]
MYEEGGDGRREDGDRRLGHLLYWHSPTPEGGEFAEGWPVHGHGRKSFQGHRVCLTDNDFRAVGGVV